MLQNKFYYIVIITFLLINKIQSQPGSKNYFFEAKICIQDNNNDIYFITKDSLNFISKKEEIQASLYLLEKENSILNNALKLENNYGKKFYTLSLIENRYFKIKVRKSMFYENKLFWYSKFLFKIEKNKKFMYVYFNYSKYKINTKLDLFDINFQEGNFEITNYEKPKLVRIKT